MSHVSVNFDRTGYQQALSTVFPRTQLHALREEGVVGSVAGTHYSFMGATPPDAMEQAARELAPRLRADGVNTVLLAPV
ncbi:MAG: hypothetical protein H6983_02575 [Ectothiorhodospiraceae bacterium]|nr:hypothetical protein [Ectothiorhodospiraceae bacterium]